MRRTYRFPFASGVWGKRSEESFSQTPCKDFFEGNTFTKVALAFFVVFGLQTSAAFAQAPSFDPGRLHQQNLEEKRIEQLTQEMQQSLQDKQAGDQPQTDPPEVPLQIQDHAPDEPVFLVKKIILDQSELLDNETLQAYIAVYEGNTVSLKDLQNLVNAINQLYRKLNIPTAVALLPEQDISDGTVEIKLIEGKVDRVTVSGNNHTNPGFIKNRLRIAEGELLRLNEVETAITTFNARHDIDVFGKLAPGQMYGSTEIQLDVLEPPNFRLNTYMNNRGNESVGKDQYGVLMQVRSLFGNRDPFTADFSRSRGSSAVTLSYQTPLWRTATRLGALYSENQVDLISDSLKALEIDGESSLFSVFLTQPLSWQRDQNLNLTLATDHRTSKTWMLGQKFIDEHYQKVRVGLDYQQHVGNGVLYTSLQFSRGFNYTQLGKNGDDLFSIYNGQLVYLSNLSASLQNTLRISVQHGSLGIPSAETFALGGGATIRGYEEGLVSGRSGYLLSNELRFPCYLLPKTLPLAGRSVALRKYVDGIVFFDMGGWKKDDQNYNPTDQDFLASVGFGARIHVRNIFTAAVDIGFPLTDVETDSDKSKLHLNLIFSLAF